MRRRDFLIGGLTTLGTSLPTLLPAQPLSHGRRFIDAHCHIFNSRDLPVEGFIKRVVIPANRDLRKLVKNYPAVADVFVDYLNTRLRNRAPDHADEIKFIDKLEGGAPRPSPDRIREDDIKFLQSILGDLLSQKVVKGRKLRFGERVVTGYAIQYLERKMVEEAFPDVVNPTRPPEEGGVYYDGNNYEPLAKNLYSSRGPAGILVRWAFLFARNRFELAETLSQIHGGRAAMLAPALVDFGAWLQDEPMVSIPEQIEVMSRISRRKDGPRVHGFVAFDPLRQAIHEKHKRADSDSPLSIAQRAIESHGLIGIKLYPPMGFRATNNAAAGKDFPDHVRFGENGLGSEPGAVLDNIMDRLYEWCMQRNVPIMAHAAKSNESRPGYATRAHPRQWARVLTKYPLLRINMAHFGGFEELGNPARIENTWEWTIGRMFENTANPYVFADLSYFNEVLGKSKTKRQQLVARLKTFRKAFPKCAGRLLYGTDWTMIGREEGFAAPEQANSYPDLVAEFLTDAEFRSDEIDQVLFGNAVKFIGLTAQDREKGTRGRLERFYANASGNATWLEAFD